MDDGFQGWLERMGFADHYNDASAPQARREVIERAYKSDCLDHGRPDRASAPVEADGVDDEGDFEKWLNEVELANHYHDTNAPPARRKAIESAYLRDQG